MKITQILLIGLFFINGKFLHSNQKAPFDLRQSFANNKLIETAKTMLNTSKSFKETKEWLKNLDQEAINTVYTFVSNYIDNELNTLLHHAKNALEVKKLLLFGADITKKNRYDQTPLISLIFFNNTEAVKAFLTYVKKIELIPDFEYAIHRAAQNGNIEIVQLLLNKGANSNALFNGATPLMAALFEKQTKMVEFLLKLQSDLTPIQRVDSYFLPDLSHIVGLTPLMLAATFDVRFVKFFLKKGVDVNAIGPYGMTALLFAIQSCIDAIDPLLEAGADVNACFYAQVPYVDRILPVDLVGMSPLILAIPKIPHKVPLLLEYGAKANQATAEGITPLIVAAIFQPSLIPLLLKYGAGVNMATLQKSSFAKSIFSNRRSIKLPTDPDKRGLTALMFAAFCGNVEAVNMLIDAGADIECATKSGIKALDFAVAGQHQEIINILRFATKK